MLSFTSPHRRRAVGCVFALIATLALAAPAVAQTVEIQTARGPAEVTSQPERTVVYDMAALDTLDALGVSGLSSINTIYLDYLADHAGDAGTLFEPDFEALNAMAPDLVIVGGRSSEQHDAVARIAPTIDMTIWGDDILGQAQDRITAYASLYAREDAGAALNAEIDAAIDAARAAAEGAGDALVVLTNGPKVSAYGTGSRFGWLHDATGLAEAADGLDTTTHGEAVSFEFIRDVDPDWLLVIDRGAAIGSDSQGARATLDNPLVRETTAWQRDQVIYLDAARIYLAGGGAQATLDTLATLTEALSAGGS
ncbi:putative ABC transporter solute-binding protein YclQ precursor [Roseivivax jejudonensis]|uniref:Putative ABC transporter solute-binding protein YclQ n=1 Tax=Roseivivax jejudonensis TaxID=1529041 RepID=A0A1X6YVG0_9RHOB|nr:siderophore ABC transporter substrate-binding protein [Roseivivax jejudonensis]SLN32349.1 putative ABC transporter solute-binding protein YclQ precursor [Roseivivax jejudonensis]